MKLIILVVCAMAVSGCASLNQAYSAYGSAALVQAQGAEDNVIRTWATAACATPFSAAIRNPAIVPALQALCLPTGAASSPIALLQAIPSAKP